VAIISNLWEKENTERRKNYENIFKKKIEKDDE